MNPLVSIFNTVLYQPLFNALILLYNYLPVHDLGLSIIILTFAVWVVIYPLNLQALRAQKALSELQPRIKALQDKYKDDKTKQAQATMELYKEAKINPFSGCLPLLIQFPILLALFRVFWKGFSPEQMAFLYGFVAKPETINTVFLGIVNLANPNAIMAILAGVAQFFQTRATMAVQKTANANTEKKALDFASMMQKQMLYIFPAFTVLIVWKMPSALALYWIASSCFAIAQNYIVFRKKI
ncbi:MAG: YidC/Oxa1 family membrane protein insertase [Patescibacteria group bacterium]